MATLAENKKALFLRWEIRLRKYVISNNNPKKKNICFFKNIFFLKFENTRLQIKAIIVSDKNVAQKRYMKLTILWKLEEFQKSKHH